MAESPCKSCTTRDPKTCGGHWCPAWHKWWINTWNTNRLKVLAALTKKEEQNNSIPKQGEEIQ